MFFHAFLRGLKIIHMGKRSGHAFLRVFLAPHGTIIFFMHFYEGRKESLWERARGIYLYVFSFVLIRKQCFSCIFTRVGNNANGNVLGTCILTCFSFVEIKNSFSIFLRGLKIMRMGKWLES